MPFPSANTFPSPRTFPHPTSSRSSAYRFTRANSNLSYIELADGVRSDAYVFDASNPIDIDDPHLAGEVRRMFKALLVEEP